MEIFSIVGTKRTLSTAQTRLKTQSIKMGINLN